MGRATERWKDDGGTKLRCAWAESDPLLRQYHDEEWGVPQFDSRALWETLMLEGFQAGLAWIIVLRKREAFRKAFRGFDPKKVARFGEKEIARMLEDPGIIRSRAKIEATIGGAKVFLQMQDEGVEFSDWVWEMAGGQPIQNTGPMVGEHAAGGDVFKGAEEAGIQICGAGDRVRVDAGGGDRERSRRGLFSAGVLREE